MVTGLDLFLVLDLDVPTFNALVESVLRATNAQKSQDAIVTRMALNASKEDFEKLLKSWERPDRIPDAKGGTDLMRDYGGGF